jgi:hypothetical protein
MPLNDRLFELLRKLKKAELDTLWVKLGEDAEDRNYAEMTEEPKVAMLSKRLRSVASHGVLDLFRKDHDYPWLKIVKQIASKLDIKCIGRSEVELEDSLYGLLDEVDRNLVLQTQLGGWKKGLKLLGPLGLLIRTMGPAYRNLTPAVLYLISTSRVRSAEEAKAAKEANRGS